MDSSGGVALVIGRNRGEVAISRNSLLRDRLIHPNFIMKSRILIAGLVIVALNASALVPSLQGKAQYMAAASIVAALWLILQSVMSKPAPVVKRERVEDRLKREVAIAKAVAASVPVSAPEVRNLSEAEALALLGVFQQKGRLIDFLMDDISSYSDAQVGAAARVVQQGCKSVLQEHFTIVPVSEEKEGALVTVPESAPSDEYSLVGKIAGEPPFSGVLVHKGWKATSVKLPRSLQADAKRLPPIAPAQVELR